MDEAGESKRRRADPMGPALERLESLHNLLETRRKEAETLNTELTRTLQLCRDLINGLDERIETLAAEILALQQMQNRMQVHLDHLTTEVERLSRVRTPAAERDAAEAGSGRR